MPRSLTTHIDSPKEVGRRLKEARDRAGLSQRQLAFPGCTAAYISRLEAGARVPSLQMVNQLAARLDVSGQWLATGVDAVEVKPPDLIDAEVALRLGDVDAAETLFRAHLAEGDAHRSAALAGLGQIAFRRGDVDAAIPLLEQALALRGGRTLADPGAADTLARAHAIAGSLDASLALLERAVEEARGAEAPLEDLRFSVLLANALIDAGNYGRAEQTLARVIRIAEDHGDPVAAARLFWSRSRLHSLRHEPQLAGRYARRALEILERTENDSYVALAWHLLACTEVEAGDGETALRHLERGRALAGSLGAREEAKFSTLEARAHLLAGRPSEAARAAKAALELVDALGPGDRGYAYVALAGVFRATEDPERAKMLLGQALELLLEFGSARAIDAARPLAELLEAEGDTAGALDVLKRATAAGSPAPVSV